MQPGATTSSEINVTPHLHIKISETRVVLIIHSGGRARNVWLKLFTLHSPHIWYLRVNCSEIVLSSDSIISNIEETIHVLICWTPCRAVYQVRLGIEDSHKV